MEPLFIRIAVGITLAMTFSVSFYYRKRAADFDASASRGDESKKLIATRLLVAVPAQLLLTGDLFFPRLFEWARLDLPFPAQIGALFLGAACAPLAVWMFRHLGSNVTATALTKDSHRLVTTGPYRWVRHPMYSIGTLLMLSIGVALENAALLAWVVVFLLAWRIVVIPEEERRLIERFGSEYEEYRKRVGALFPRPF